eukprot:761600-Hanusia_phi.AAC.9
MRARKELGDGKIPTSSQPLRTLAGDRRHPEVTLHLGVELDPGRVRLRQLLRAQLRHLLVLQLRLLLRHDKAIRLVANLPPQLLRRLLERLSLLRHVEDLIDARPRQQPLVPRQVLERVARHAVGPDMRHMPAVSRHQPFVAGDGVGAEWLAPRDRIMLARLEGVSAAAERYPDLGVVRVLVKSILPRSAEGRLVVEAGGDVLDPRDVA